MVFSSANETNTLKLSLHFSNVHKKNPELKNKRNQHRIAFDLKEKSCFLERYVSEPSIAACVELLVTITVNI